MHYKRYKTILSPRNGMNLYRGCTHGCIYCDSRSTCYQMDHDFEDVEVKTGAPQILEAQLRARQKRCMVGTGAMCDPYIPFEKELGVTRECLEVIDRYGFGVAIQTKSDLILRDLDLLTSIHRQAKCVVQMTLTTADETLCKKLEPSVCGTARRAEVLGVMRENGIPTVVWFCPLLPFINDTEENLRGILDYCTRADVYGILNFGIGVTLREGDRDYFYAALDRLFPGLRKKYQQKYGLSYEVMSDRNDELMPLFYSECRQRGIVCDNDEIFRFMHTLPEGSGQLSFF